MKLIPAEGAPEGQDAGNKEDILKAIKGHLDNVNDVGAFVFAVANTSASLGGTSTGGNELAQLGLAMQIISRIIRRPDDEPGVDDLLKLLGGVRNLQGDPPSEH